MRNRFLFSVGLSDFLALAGAIVVASSIVFDVALPWTSAYGARVYPMLGFMAVSLFVASLLTAQMSGPGVPRPTYGRMSAISIMTAAGVALMLVFFRPDYWSRAFLVYSGAVWMVLATAHRTLRRLRPWTERLAVVTAEKQLADDVALSDHAEVDWVLDPQHEGRLDLPDRGVTIAVDLRAVLSQRVAQFLSSADVAGYTIRPFTSIYEDHTGRVPLVHLSEGWEISAPLLEVASWLPGKRAFDVVVTVILAPVWLTIGLLVGLYVRVTSGSPVIFHQKRVGYLGKTFTMHKFRTMVAGAEEDGPRFAGVHDDRLIPGGGFLRKSRFDEIPQLWNVLMGEMSLVGPRAEQVPFVEEFRTEIPFYEHRHLVRPGLTGWAQVNYGYADDQAETIEKLTYDLYYIKHMSPVMDSRVLWKSVWTVLTGFGAR